VTPEIGGAAIGSAVIEPPPVVALDAAVAAVADVGEKPALASLVVEIRGASDATVEIDGEVVLRSGKRAKAEVTRGVHEIVVKASGRKPETRTVDTSGGDKLVEIEMERVKTAGGSDRGSGKGSGAASGSGNGTSSGSGSGSASVSGSGSGSASGSGKVDNDALVDPFRRKKTTP
jgi:hypothetical protein